MINLTKAIITEKLEDCKFKVRIPILETPGSNEIYEVRAIVSYQPGNLESYKVGDVVFVSFENNDLDKVVITGKLYRGPEEEAVTAGYLSTLKVDDSVVLPQNTKIGNLTYKDLEELQNRISILEEAQSGSSGTVNNSTITFIQGSTLVGSINLNQPTAATLTFDAGGGEYDPGLGILIENSTISVDDDVVALDNDVDKLVPYAGTEEPDNDKLIWIETDDEETTNSLSLQPDVYLENSIISKNEDLNSVMDNIIK